jgi:glycosyltransferase involved in cell wall biosynthesis
MDKIVCISPFHQTYFHGTYGIENAIVIDLPIRVHDLDGMNIEKRPNSLIFTSVPDRGLHFLRQAWDRLKKEIPDLSLTITSDYRLWGLQEPRNERFRQEWIAVDDVSFIGAVKRQELLKIQMEADLFVFPNIYDELFCVSLAEAQVCGAYPITSEVGALRTTSLGMLIKGNPRDPRSGFLKKFQEAVIEIFKDRNALRVKQEDVKKRAIERFHPDTILKQWDEQVFK